MEELQYSDSITFNKIDRAISLQKNALKQWIIEITNREKFKVSSLNYNFCSDDILLQINRKHLNHDYYTDIITFDLSDSGKIVEGDIYISIDRVKDNAKKLKAKYKDELLRVIAHGILHLVGYNDKTDYQKNQMRSKEDEYIHLYYAMFHVK